MDPTTIKHLQRRAAAQNCMLGLFIFFLIVITSPVWEGFLFPRSIDDSSIYAVARFQAKKLKDACQTFYIRHKRIPKQIEDLVDPNLPGGAILEDRAAIIDPWGHPYQITLGPLGTPMIVSKGKGGEPITSSD